MTAAVVSIGMLLLLGLVALVPFALGLWLIEIALERFAAYPVSLLLVLVRSLRRNRLRTYLTFIATFVLVFVVGGIWSVLYFLDGLLSDQNKSPRVVVRDKWQLVSEMPMSYAGSLATGAARKRGDVRPTDSMTWQVYVGTTDPSNPSPENSIPCVAMEPAKLLTMMDDIFSELATDGGSHRGKSGQERRRELEEYVRKLEANRRGLLIGANRLAALNKRVGDWIKLTGMQHRNIDLEFQIVGVFPAGRYRDLGVIQRDYFDAAFDDFARKHGFKHPLAGRTLTMVWLQMPAAEDCGRVADQIQVSGLYQDPPVRCQTLSAEVAAALDAYADLIWGLRWVLSPAILVIMTLVMANAIGISVRERAPEIALLKVLGFRPVQVLLLVLGEPALIGALAGLFGAVFSQVVINNVLNQLVESPVDIPPQALWWCPLTGLLTALIGSLVPAWMACRVRAAQVFARTA
jgi:putative ABC transport system permease protein